MRLEQRPTNLVLAWSQQISHRIIEESKQEKNFQILQNYQTSFLEGRQLTEEANILLEKAMRLGFSYVANPRNFNTK